MQYRKKPVVIEAMQFTGGSCTNEGAVPEWFVRGVLDRVIVAFPEHIEIHTLEGVMRAYPGEWIIRGVKGELYPCKPDIFAATYDPVSHLSWCALHNAPALPVGPCNCGAA